MVKFCPSCGNKVKEGSKFCLSCGAKLQADISGAQASQTSSTQVPPYQQPMQQQKPMHLCSQQNQKKD